MSDEKRKDGDTREPREAGGVDYKVCEEMGETAEDVGPIAVAFTEEIAPLIEKIREASERLNIPHFLSFILDRRDDIGGIASSISAYYGETGADDMPKDEDRAEPIVKFARIATQGWVPVPPEIAAQGAQSEAARRVLGPVLEHIRERVVGGCDCEECKAQREANEAKDKGLIN